MAELPGRTYHRRIVDDELDELLPQLPAILLDGPRGVGKTTTAIRRCVASRALDDPAVRAVVEADPNLVALDPRPLLIDEWQLVRPTWDVVRRQVDMSPRGGQFLLTGSLPDRQTHSGAGRITSIRMRPLTLPERGSATATVSLRALLDGDADITGRSPMSLPDYVREITGSGFPGFRGISGRALSTQLASYVQRIAERDIEEAGYAVRRPATVLAWLRAYAAATGTTASWEKIRRAAMTATDAPPSRSTTQPYIELLTALRILDPLPAWSPSSRRFQDLVQAPKHYLADPSLAARLVRRGATQLLQGDMPETVVPREGGFLGSLFEALAALSIRVFAQAVDADVHHLRSEQGRREVDFVIEDDAGLLGIEVKMSSTIGDHDVRHLLWLRDRIGSRCRGLVVLHAGPEAYRRPDGVAVVPLAMLGP